MHIYFEEEAEYVWERGHYIENEEEELYED